MRVEKGGPPTLTRQLRPRDTPRPRPGSFLGSRGSLWLVWDPRAQGRSGLGSVKEVDRRTLARTRTDKSGVCLNGEEKYPTRKSQTSFTSIGASEVPEKGGTERPRTATGRQGPGADSGRRGRRATARSVGEETRHSSTPAGLRGRKFLW